MIHKNAVTEFCRVEYMPEIDPSAFVHPLAAVIGRVSIGGMVMVSPFASIRGDEGHPIVVGDESNVQDGVVIHALETECNGKPVENNMVEVDGERFAVYVGKRVSLAHQAQIHGPALVEDDTFVGMKTLVFKARVGRNCVIEPGCILMGVTVSDGMYVPAGTVLKDQKSADALPRITDDYPFKGLNRNVVRVNTGISKGYKNIEI
ncbi:carbonic anhydrase [Thermodesulfobacteriota bacterium]